MVRRPFSSSSLHVHFDAKTFLCQRSSGQYVVDTPAEIPLECIPEVIPIGILDSFRVQLSKHVDKTLGDRLVVGVPSVDMKVDIVHPSVRVVDINGFWSDVQVTHPKRGLLRIEMLLE